MIIIKFIDNYFQSILLATFLLFLIFIYKNVIWIDPKNWKFLSKLKGPRRLPIFGNVLEIITLPHHEMVNFGLNFYKTFGNTGVLWLFNNPYVIMFSGTKNIEKVLTSTINIEKGNDYDNLKNWLGTGLLTSGSEKWRTRRKLLTPAFHFKILEDYLDIFNEQSLILIDLFKKESQKNKAFDICPYITRCSLDIICETAMGKKVNAQTQINSEFIKSVHGICEMIIERSLKPWYRPNLIWNLTLGRLEKKYLKVLHGFTESVIKERKKYHSSSSEIIKLKTGKKSRLAFLDLLIDASENGKYLTDLDIREETDTFLFEGHDTISTSMSWTIFLLAKNTEIQKKTQMEVDEIFKSLEKENTLNMEDLSKLKYLECVIKESLRIFPSVPFFLRKLVSDVELEEDNIKIPAGVKVIISPFILHRDESIYPDPEIFKPERFFSSASAENSEDRNKSPFSYIPFSAGPRNCIGQRFAILEEKVVLAHILRNFTLECDQIFNYSMLLPDVVLRSKNGIFIKMYKR